MKESPYSKLTREEVAEREVGSTTVSRRMSFVLVFLFLFSIISVPLVQHSIEVSAGFASGKGFVWPKAYDALRYPGEAVAEFRKPGSLWQKIQAANARFMHLVRTFETDLEDDSFLATSSIPHTQAFTAEFFGLGNEQVLLGKKGWLFYQPEVAYLTGPGFLRADVLTTRSRMGHADEAIQPDPVKAIVDFRDQLQARGIRLILLPAPVKPMIEPEHLSGRYHSPLSNPLQNPSFDQFRASLEEHGVEMLDVSGDLTRRKLESGEPQFLETDTHWTPSAMELAAGRLAEKLTDFAGKDPWSRGETEVANLGDIAAMLKLPPNSKLYPLQKVTIHQVQTPDGTLASSSPILVLGDSFSNIYSLAPMGWGASAGFVEQLSYLLKTPVDSILRNDAGAYATRELLAKELAQGKDRLVGKKVVVWEFAMRELAVGDWKMIRLPEVARQGMISASPTEAGFFAPEDGGEPVRVSGVIQSASKFPRPGSVPYKDHIFAVELDHLNGPGVPDGGKAVVYLWSMKDNVLTKASAWKPGDRVELALRSWNEVAPEYDRFNRSELEDDSLAMETPCWGETNL